VGGGGDPKLPRIVKEIYLKYLYKFETNSTFRIKEQEKCQNLNEHDDDDDEALVPFKIPALRRCSNPSTAPSAGNVV
jgi:hypothetical protein